MMIYTMLDVEQGLCSTQAHLTEKGALIHAITNLFVYLEIRSAIDLESFLKKGDPLRRFPVQYNPEAIIALKDITFKPLDLSETNNKDLRLLLEVLNTEIDYLDLGIMVKVDNSELQL